MFTFMPVLCPSPSANCAALCEVIVREGWWLVAGRSVEVRSTRRGWSNVRRSRPTHAPFRLRTAPSQAFAARLPWGGSDWQRLLDEALRVLVPGGRIAMIDATPLRGPWKLAERPLVGFERRVAAWESPQPPIERVVGELLEDATVEAALGGLWAIIAGKKPQDLGDSEWRRLA